ncbi:hypothetical protein FFI16_009330 [Pseudomonas sp. KBS0710]|nr:hypothetical protein FFI16_009330 [Pseudomonas sp. KBS0710]
MVKTKVKSGFTFTWDLLFCGSWLACDGLNSVCLMYRGDAIAGKPAPTVDRVWLCCCSGPLYPFR